MMTCTIPGCGAPLARTNQSGYCNQHRGQCPKTKADKARWFREHYAKSSRKVMTPGERKSRRAEKRLDWDSTFARVRISAEEYKRRAEEQQNRCAVCQKEAHKDFRGRLAVDHCHITNKVRGLLCHNCNLMLGHAKDSVEVLEKAAKYLEGYPLDGGADQGDECSCSKADKQAL